MKRTDRDMAILKTLATKVRFLSLAQVATWWDGTSAVASARRRLIQLGDAGFVELTRVRGDPMLELSAPVCTWSPGERDPDFRAVSRTLRDRWPEAQPSHYTVYLATQATNNRLGGPERRKPTFSDQISHDLHVSEIYIRLLRADPGAAAAWLGEDVLGKAGYKLKDPDAIIRREDGSELAIEFGGRYDPERVQDLHVDCAKRGRPYELW